MIPAYLKPGDAVALIAPARFMDMQLFTPFEQWVQQQGWFLKKSPNLGNVFHQLGGSPSERLEDILWALNNNEIKAVFMARGGYGTMQLLPELKQIDFTSKPKWWVGFSDITALHIHLQNQNLSSIHGPMAMQFNDLNKCSENSKKSLLDVLRGKEVRFTMSDGEPNVHTQVKGPIWINKQKFNTKTIKLSGKLWGGNLSLIYAMLAAGYKVPNEKFILFVEDLDEYYYHIDRMIQALLLAGVFQKAEAILVGSMCDMRDNETPFGISPLETLTKIGDFYQKPLIWGLPVGHQSDNMPLKLGFDINFDGSFLFQN